MTREEAIEAVNIGSWPDFANARAQFVDRLIALDVLKVETPKTATDKATEVINKMIKTYGGTAGYPIIVSSHTILEELDAAGIRVVDK